MISSSSLSVVSSLVLVSSLARVSRSLKSALPRFIVTSCLICSLSVNAALSISDQPNTAQADNAEVASTIATESAVATPEQQASFRNKLYRQALYYYFEGDYNAALRQVAFNRQRFEADTAKSHLFEAGLQVSIGLHHQATQTLATFEQALIDQQAKDKLAGISPQSTDSIIDDKPNETNSAKSNTSAAELKLIALLQLSEQQIEQGKLTAAQRTLGKINQLPASYAEQYLILNQLAHWPVIYTATANIIGEASSKFAVNLDDEAETIGYSSLSAYVMLNQALQMIEVSDFQGAEQLLTRLKNIRLAQTETSFWQDLFTEKSPQSVNSDVINNQAGSSEDSANDKMLQQQAIKDYAQLLLAQMYVKQTQYQAAFDQLKDFPQLSPYTESALFLFAFSAQQVNQYTTSTALLDLLTRQYPHSQLGWQSALLLSAQIKQQNTLAESLTSYQQAEQLYLQQLADLERFQKDIKQHKFVSIFDNQNPLTTQNDSQSLWLQKALKNPELKNDVDTLTELTLLKQNLFEQQQKNAWIKETIELNKRRQTRIIKQQKQTPYAELIQQLTLQQQQLSITIAEAEQQQNARIFANEAEQDWLNRVNQSHQIIAVVNGQRNTEDYQQRLARVEAVLDWKLQQQFPQRLWQHKKLLKEVEQQLIIATKQQQRFALLANAQQQTNPFEQRQVQAELALTKVTKNIAQLTTATEQKIQQKIAVFVSQQQSQLQQLLLISRHEMAAVLEQMSQMDSVPMASSAPKATTSLVNTKEGL
ncbi:tetratricopeptide repeat protein [Shewanella sp. TC10]|uniref:tetratricopeptide repeat protein n=1 Tax=Shewanella sp. TC10 TaxID=1419739 RepID=UPI00129D697B|nr:hypothetical protein [Shewanella sp. TC10]